MEENYGDTRTVARCRQTRMADAGLYRNRITELLFRLQTFEILDLIYRFSHRRNRGDT